MLDRSSDRISAGLCDNISTARSKLRLAASMSPALNFSSPAWYAFSALTISSATGSGLGRGAIWACPGGMGAGRLGNGLSDRNQSWRVGLRCRQFALALISVAGSARQKQGQHRRAQQLEFAHSHVFYELGF